MPNFLINVKTKGAKAATKSVKALSGGLKTLTKVGMVGAAGGAVALGAAMKKATDAAREQERVEAKLFGAIGNSAKALIEQAGALQQNSKYGDEAIISQQAYLASIGMTENQITKTIAASVDLAAATGMSLESAVKNASKTLSGMTGELGESVPQLRELTAEELKAGKGIEVMAKLFDGAAKNEINTFDGALTQAQNSIGDAAEEMGKILLPMVTEGAKKMKGFAESVGAGFKELGGLDFGATAKNILGNIQGLSNVAISIFKLAFGQIPELFGFFMAKVYPVITQFISTAWENFKTFAKFVFEPVWIASKMAWEKVKYWWDLAIVGITNGGIGIINFFKEAWATISGSSQIAFLSVAKGVEQIFVDVKNVAIGIINGLIGTYNKAAGFLGMNKIDLIEPVNEAEIGKKYEDAIANVRTNMANVEKVPLIDSEGIKEEYKKSQEALKSEMAGTSMFEALTAGKEDSVTDASSFVDEMGNIVNEYYDSIKVKKEEMEADGTSTVPGGYTQADLDKQDELRALEAEKRAEQSEQNKELTEEEKKAKQQMIEDLKASRKAESDNFVSNMSTMAQAFPAAEKASKRAAQAQAIVDTYASANAAYKAMVGIPVVGPALAVGAAAAAVGAGMANVKQIEKAQFGLDRVVDSPTLIMAGEAGAESVNITPLNTDTGGAMGGGGTTINLSGNVMSEQFVEDELADKIADATRRGTSFA